jgi:hypothetical protein
VGDFNGDGRDDVATSDWNSVDVSVLLNEGTWFDTPSTTAVAGLPGRIATADFRGTGRTDLAVASPGALNILLADGHGGLTAGPTFNDCYGSVAVGDANNDGIPHLVYTGGSGVGVRLGDGAGGFGPPTYYAVAYAGDVAVGDFNNDGNLDVATSISRTWTRTTSASSGATATGPSGRCGTRPPARAPATSRRATSITRAWTTS